jgi:capsid protein
MMMTVPAGYEPTGLEPTQPHANYAEFKKEILLEAARALNMPYNVAAGISESYNYASGRLDHQTYHRTLQVERDTVERRALDAMLAAWWYETALVSPDLDPLAPPRHRWMWPGFQHVDPVKEASAEAIRLSNGTITLADIASEAGQDWRRQVDQRAEEREYLREKGLLAEADQSIAANADEGRAAAHQPEPTR